MNTNGVEQAMAAAISVASAQRLLVEDVVVIQNSNKLALRLLPCDVFARVAPIGDQVAALEVELAQKLFAAGAPIARLEAGVEPLVYLRDGFAITLWSYYHGLSPDSLEPSGYAHTLIQLHSAMRGIEVLAPHFTDRITEAQSLVANPNRTPALNISDREFLLDTLSSARSKIQRVGAAEQLLHGEPHPGNILNTANGPLFIDLETCCFGPVEFDLAHAPGDVSAHYANLDQELLSECRRFVLAMVAAWRWDIADQFPGGLRHGQVMLALLRNGPPWPTLDELRTG